MHKQTLWLVVTLLIMGGSAADVQTRPKSTAKKARAEQLRITVRSPLNSGPASVRSFITVHSSTAMVKILSTKVRHGELACQRTISSCT